MIGVQGGKLFLVLESSRHGLRTLEFQAWMLF